MKSISVYKRKKRYILRAKSKTTAGIWISTDINEIFDIETPQDEVVKEILSLLEHSKINVPHPTDWNEFENDINKPFLKKIGVKTWQDFYKGSYLCQFKEENGNYTITPYSNTGKGFKPKQEEKFELSIYTSKNQIAEALLKCFELCE